MNKLGFGFLRLPMNGEEIDYTAVNGLVDGFLAGGGTYFDTAYTYLDGKSEEAIRRCLVERHPRDRFLLASKLPGYDAVTSEDCQRIFAESLRRCGTTYFDVYMLHWLNEKHYRLAQERGQFDFLQELKQKGLAKRIGFSFHDTADLLDRILTEHPEVDCVLLQINYLDWESSGIQSRLCYETAVRHGKSVLVMEPVKGGTLVNIPSEAAAAISQMEQPGSPAFQAIRFAQSLAGVEVVLSGMNSMEQLRENLQSIKPMSVDDLQSMQQAAAAIRKAVSVGCTGCGYCLRHCPQELPIPRLFSLYNEYALYPRHKWKLIPAYRALGAAADNCLGCHACQAHCPQKLPIPEHLKAVSQIFDKK